MCVCFRIAHVLGGNPIRALDVEIYRKKVRLYTDSKMYNTDTVRHEMMINMGEK